MQNPDTKKTLSLLKDFAKAASGLGLERLQEQLAASTRQIERGIYTIVVVGEVKKGKSSLINTLLNLDKLLPVAEFEVMTSTAFHLVFGPQRRNTVFFKPTAGRQLDSPDDVESLFESATLEEHQTGKEISDEEIATYGTEAGNPDNCLEVDHIRIELPNELLQAGLEIIDTPGLGGLLPYHAQLTWKYIPTADAVLFVLDSDDSPLTRDEAQWITKIRNFTPLVVFAQTKIDRKASEQWQAWRERNLDELSKLLKRQREEIQYFAVSSKLRSASSDPTSTDYQRSGFAALEAFFFTELPTAVIGRQCREVLRVLTDGLQCKIQEIVKSHQVLVETSVEKLEALKRQYTAIANNLREIETRIYPDLRDELSSEIDRIREEGVQQINDFLHPSLVNPEFNAFVENLQHNKAAPQEINRKIDQLATSFIDGLSQKVLIFYQSYQRDIFMLVDRYTHNLREHLEEANVIDPDLEKSSAAQEAFLGDRKPAFYLTGHPPANKIEFNQWDAIRNYSMGVGLGGGLALTSAAIATIFFPPVWLYAGWVALGGKVIGAILSGRSAREKNVRQILAHLHSVFSGLMTQLNRKVVHQFREDIQSIKTQAHREFKRLIREARDFADGQQAAIKQQIERHGKPDQEALSKIEKQRDTVKNLLNYADRIQQPR